MFPLDTMMDIRQLISHRQNYRTANLFGVIAYTERNPHIVMALEERAYWDSLNARTENWILYAARPNSEWAHLTDDYILPQLGVLAEGELPVLIVFAIGPNQTILQKEFPIDDSGVETAYNSIENTVMTISRAIKGIDRRYISSTNVYREVVKALDAVSAKNRWKNVTEEMKKLFNFLASLSGLV